MLRTADLEKSGSLQYPVTTHNTQRPLISQMYCLDLMYTGGFVEMYNRPGMQEIESILDNPDEMGDMYLANKEAALDAEAEQVRIPGAEAMNATAGPVTDLVMSLHGWAEYDRNDKPGFGVCCLVWPTSIVLGGIHVGVVSTGGCVCRLLQPCHGQRSHAPGLQMQLQPYQKQRLRQSPC